MNTLDKIKSLKSSEEVNKKRQTKSNCYQL